MLSLFNVIPLTNSITMIHTCNQRKSNKKEDILKREILDRFASVVTTRKDLSIDWRHASMLFPSSALLDTTLI